MFVVGLLVMTPLTFAQGVEAEGQLDEPSHTKAREIAVAIESENYWTPEKMANAKPMPVPEVVFDDLTLESADKVTVDEAEVDSVLPGFSPGWEPGVGRQPAAGEAYVITPEDPIFSVAKGLAQPQHGSRPSNPRAGGYGPFQRWTEFDSLTVYPKSTLGKLFFTLNGANFVCSATVIQKNTLITAGHCNSDGDGTFVTNRLFCPSYRNGSHSTRGCWAVVNSKTSNRWHNNGDPDYDYACLITSPTGTRLADEIGDVTGWLGRAWNFNARHAVRTFGYPAAPPFNGQRLVTTASTEWYTFHFRPGGQSSKFIGSDMTGGASGGSWILGWSRAGQEFSDSDGRRATDPGFNWVTGVNSHKRCRSNCQSPPTNSSGLFWQEMSSPPFRKSSAGDQSEDIIAICLGLGGA